MTDKKLYLTRAQLISELGRCLGCKSKPCMNACPVNCNPQEFIAKAKANDFAGAVETITRNNPMGQTCGLICPDKFCMQACQRQKSRRHRRRAGGHCRNGGTFTARLPHYLV